MHNSPSPCDHSPPSNHRLTTASLTSHHRPFDADEIEEAERQAAMVRYRQRYNAISDGDGGGSDLEEGSFLSADPMSLEEDPAPGPPRPLPQMLTQLNVHVGVERGCEAYSDCLTRPFPYLWPFSLPLTLPPVTCISFSFQT